MQLLSFSIAGQPFAIESRCVIEVLPLVPARPLTHAPDYLAGIFTYRGRLLPLIDLARRLGVAPPPPMLSTRVIVVEFQPDAIDHENAARPGPVRLGLVAENVVTVRSTDEATSSLPPVRMPGADYLDRTLRIGGETVQVLDVGKLLPAELAAGFAAARPAEAGP